MKKHSIAINFQVYPQLDDLPTLDHQLMTEAKAALQEAYAPYSDYQVGAAILLKNGEILRGSNQENAAYPMCLCAERVALGAAASRFPGVPVIHMAITTAKGNTPAAPCGACRQVMAEHEQRYHTPIRTVLMANAGDIYIFETALDLLPLAFSGGFLE